MRPEAVLSVIGLGMCMLLCKAYLHWNHPQEKYRRKRHEDFRRKINESTYTARDYHGEP